MSAPAAATLARLGDLVGAEHTRTEPQTLARYEVDGVRPAAALLPGSAEEVAEVVRFAAAHKLALVPVGARQGLTLGMPPARYDVALDLSRLEQVVAYDPGDLTLTVEAGLPVARLNAVLAAKNQFLPLEMPGYERITVGGVLAAHGSGPQRHAYGTVRDFTLGMEFVTGEGLRTKSGARVVKNVTGYDLHKVLIGSLGTLAVITAAHFRTFPLPPAQATLVASFGDAAGALALCRAIGESPLGPQALEIASPGMARLLDPEGRRLPEGAWSLVAAAAGNEHMVKRHAADIKQLAQGARAKSFTRLAGEQEKRLWRRIREFPSLARETSPAATVVKLNLLPSRFADAIAAAEQAAARAELPCAIQVRAVGVVYAVLLPPAQQDEATLARLAQVVAAQQQAAVEYGGSSLVESCPVALKQRVNVWGPPEGSGRADFALMRRIKQTFDPGGVLSPGRYAGGL